jgi:hypothetical protein
VKEERGGGGERRWRGEETRGDEDIDVCPRRGGHLPCQLKERRIRKDTY